MCTCSPMKGDLESVPAVWICIFIVSWSCFFFFLSFFFFCHTPSSFILQGNGACQQNLFFNERRLWSVLNRCITSYLVVFSQTESTAPPSICIAFVILEWKQSANSVSKGTACTSRLKSALARCWSWIDALFTLRPIAGATLKTVDLSWSQQTMKHWGFDICLEGGATRWTWNGALGEKKENCFRNVRAVYKEGKKAIYYTFKEKRQCFTCRAKVLQVRLNLKGGEFLVQLSAGEDAKKKAVTDRKQLFIRTHIHRVPAAVCTIFQDRGAIHICLPYTQIPKKNTHSSSTERGLLLSHMSSCAHTAISI